MKPTVEDWKTAIAGRTIGGKKAAEEMERGAIHAMLTRRMCENMAQTKALMAECSELLKSPTMEDHAKWLGNQNKITRLFKEHDLLCRELEADQFETTEIGNVIDGMLSREAKE